MTSILTNPKYGPKSELGGNAFTYLKFGLPRVGRGGAGVSGGNLDSVVGTPSGNHRRTPRRGPTDNSRYGWVGTNTIILWL